MWKTSLIMKNSFLVKSFFDKGKIFSCGKPVACEKLFRSRKNHFLWKTSMFVENLLNEGKIFACGKLPWRRKNVDLWRKLLDNRKIICLWKKKSYYKANASVETNKVYISKSKAKTQVACLFVVDKINIIFLLVKLITNWRLQNSNEPFNVCL